MQDDTTASLAELLGAHQGGQLSVTADLTAYILLCLAEQLRDDQHLRGAILSVDGAVAVINGPRTKDTPSATASLTAQLREFLASAGTPALALQTLAMAPANTPISVWAESLAKSLMPMNRDASKRALGRCIRELKRAQSTFGLRAMALGDGTVPQRLSLTPPPPSVAPMHAPALEVQDAALAAQSSAEPVSVRLRALLGEYDEAQSEEIDTHLRTIAGLHAEPPASKPATTSAMLERVSVSRPHNAAKWVAGLLLLALGLAWALAR